MKFSIIAALASAAALAGCLKDTPSDCGELCGKWLATGHGILGGVATRGIVEFSRGQYVTPVDARAVTYGKRDGDRIPIFSRDGQAGVTVTVLADGKLKFPTSHGMWTLTRID